MLPFANLGGDPEQDYFCEGLAEEILNALTRIPGLRVMARTSSFSFRGKGQDIPQIGQALNLSPILRGGVRRSGTRFRITVQLIHAGNGYHLWSETIEREANDAWAVQEQIARAIVAAIQLELTPEQRLTSADTHTPDSDAFELYLKAPVRLRIPAGSFTAQSRGDVSKRDRRRPVLFAAACRIGSLLFESDGTKPRVAQRSRTVRESGTGAGSCA